MENVLVDRAPARLRRPARLLRLASDERLVALVRSGDEGAFEALYDRHHPAILGFCRHMLGTREEAEDAVQHTFLAAFRDLARHEKPVELRPWLFAIARNRCLSLLRARRMHVAIELAEPATDGLAATVERREDLRELLSDLASLPEDQRAALLLAELGALDHAGIATVLGCPREKVKALVFQARTSLAASREARATPCDEIRLELASASGAALRRGPLRRHLRTCDGCRAFKAEVATQRKLFALALPVVPTLALKGSVLSGTGIASTSGGGSAAAAAGATTAGATSSASGGALGGVLGTVASTGAGKVVVSLAVAGAVAGGGSALSERLGHRSAPPASSPGTLAPDRGQSIAPTPFAIGGVPVHDARHGDDASAPPTVHHERPSDSVANPSTATPVPVPPDTRRPQVSAAPRSTQPPVHADHKPSHPSHAGGGSAGQGAVPPGHSGTPPGHGGTPPGQQTSPPGHAYGDGPGVAPPGHGGTPPGQGKASSVPRQSKAFVPPGQGRASTTGAPGSASAAPPGLNKPPPAPRGLSKASDVPPGQARATPPARSAPAVGSPPGSPSTPPGQSGASHGKAGAAPGESGASHAHGR
ncbi:MAG TPA: sigma-70 family RNA polymerase sigma factor [Conexibacter sp.]